MSYMKVILNPETLEESDYVLRLSDKAFINKNNNEEYLKWIEEGNQLEEWNPGGSE